MSLIACIKRKIKKVKSMAKNAHKRGKSVRNGNAPSPYTKYGKTPYKYEFLRKEKNKVIHLEDVQKEKDTYNQKKKMKKKAA